MAKPTRPGHGAGDADGATPSRDSRAPGSRAQSIAEAQETTAQDVRRGRPIDADQSPASDGGAGLPAGTTPAGPTNDLVTQPTGEYGGTPDGDPTRVRQTEDADVRRSLERENSGAAILADQGHQIRQNPSADEVAQARQETGDTGRPTSKPDYLLEGRVFDCYSPSQNKSVRGIWSEVETKIKDDQTQRVVVNLEDWRGSVSDLRRQFDGWPIERLKEVKAITPDGDIVQIVPNREND